MESSWWLEGRQDVCLKLHPDGGKDMNTAQEKGFSRIWASGQDSELTWLWFKLGSGPGGVLSKNLERVVYTLLGPFCVTGTAQSSSLTSSHFILMTAL